jgi:hypothetical protein
MEPPAFVPVDGFKEARDKTGVEVTLTLTRLTVQAGPRTPRVVIELRKCWQ